MAILAASTRTSCPPPCAQLVVASVDSPEEAPALRIGTRLAEQFQTIKPTSSLTRIYLGVHAGRDKGIPALVGDGINHSSEYQ